jgi:ABC-type uncharacterized transport system substrate-binding protein
MLDRRTFIGSFAGGLLAVPLAARAQQDARTRRIGILMGITENDPEGQARVAAFRQGLHAVRVAVIFNPDTAPHSLFMPALEAAAPSVALKLIRAPVRDTAAIENAIATLGREPGGGLVVMPDVFVTGLRELVIALAARNRVAAVYPFRYWVAQGGLLAYGPDIVDQFRRVATYIDRVLRGAKPADLPVQAPTKFELAINLRTAKAVGLTIPQSLLVRADEVIE